MNEAEAIKSINRLNKYIQRELWFDFELMQYEAGTLRMIGGIDLSSRGSENVDIQFTQVFFASLPAEWMTDTSTPPVRLLTAGEAFGVKRVFGIDQECHIFRFNPEYYPEDFGCLVGAKEISFRLLKKNTST